MNYLKNVMKFKKKLNIALNENLIVNLYAIKISKS